MLSDELARFWRRFVYGICGGAAGCGIGLVLFIVFIVVFTRGLQAPKDPDLRQKQEAEDARTAAGFLGVGA
jgi:hypothetical protein